MRLIKVTEDQQREIEELKARLRKDSGNSSKPPSSDAPWSKRRRQRRPASGKKPGGQPGHEGTSRAQFDAGAVDAVRDHHPAACPACGGHEIEALGRPPVRHQVTEIPTLAAEVTEHRRHRGRCRSCGEELIAPLPADVPRGAFGPRLQAMVVALTGVYRLSRREVPRLLRDAFGVRMGLGSVANTEARIARSLEGVHGQALDAVRSARVLHVDETPWRLRGSMPWLWTATTDHVTAFRVDERRSFEALKRLIGEGFPGRVVSDRMGAYDKLPIERRQICWSHLDRDFKALAEGVPGEQDFGRRAVRIALLNAIATIAPATTDPWKRFPAVLGIPEVAAILGITEGSAREAARRGNVPMVRRLGRYMVDQVVFRRWVAGFDVRAEGLVSSKGFPA